MSALLGSLLGFGGSIIPTITDYFGKKQDQKFELAKMEKKAELIKNGYTHEMTMFEQQANDKEHERLIEHDISINRGTGFISALQKSVRPVITYCFFILFAIVEINLLTKAMAMDVPFDEALALVWDDDTSAIFAAIMSFWFGNRAMEKARNRIIK
jgi:hypothetical protein